MTINVYGRKVPAAGWQVEERRMDGGRYNGRGENMAELKFNFGQRMRRECGQTAFEAKARFAGRWPGSILSGNYLIPTNKPCIIRSAYPQTTHSQCIKMTDGPHSQSPHASFSRSCVKITPTPILAQLRSRGHKRFTGMKEFCCSFLPSLVLF